MSANNPTLTDGLSTASTAVPTATSSKDDVSNSKIASTFLSVPHNRLLRRTSIDSAFSGSDISELSFGSTEVGSVHHEGLIRVLSATSSNIINFPGPSAWRSRLSDFWVANYGAFLILVSQMFGCFMNIATRLLETPGSHGEPMHPFQILFVRQSITSLLCTSYALWSKSIPHFPLGPPGTVRLLLVSRGFFGFLGVFGLYFSLLYLPLSEATILTFLAPIGSCYAFALLLPGETFTKRQQIAAFVSLLGVVFIARPASLFKSGGEDIPVSGPDVGMPGNNTILPEGLQGPPQPTPTQHLQAIGVAMIGVVGAIGAMTSIRSIGQRAHPFLSVNYFSIWCTFVSVMALIFLPTVKFRLPSNFLEWGLLSVLGFCGFIMQWLLTVGMAYGASPAPSKLPADSITQDLEMQARSVEARALGSMGSAASAADRVDSSQRTNMAQTPVKASGAKATSMMYTQMLFALVADKVVFGVTPGLWSWFGSSLILIGAIWVAAEGAKSRTESPKVSGGGRRVGTTHSQKDLHTEHEEEVGLLRDIDGTGAILDEMPSQATAATSSSEVSERTNGHL